MDLHTDTGLEDSHVPSLASPYVCVVHNDLRMAWTMDESGHVAQRFYSVEWVVPEDMQLLRMVRQVCPTYAVVADSPHHPADAPRVYLSSAGVSILFNHHQHQVNKAVAIEELVEFVETDPDMAYAHLKPSAVAVGPEARDIRRKLGMQVAGVYQAMEETDIKRRQKEGRKRDLAAQRKAAALERKNAKSSKPCRARRKLCRVKIEWTFEEEKEVETARGADPISPVAAEPVEEAEAMCISPRAEPSTLIDTDEPPQALLPSDEPAGGPLPPLLIDLTFRFLVS